MITEELITHFSLLFLTDTLLIFMNHTFFFIFVHVSKLRSLFSTSMLLAFFNYAYVEREKMQTGDGVYETSE